MPESTTTPTTSVARRNLLRASGAALGVGLGMGLTRAAGATLAATGRAPRRSDDTRPNVLWIITDDATRRTLRTMPHTRRLLVEPGVNFVNGYAAVPVCGPSRASMLTGMYAHNHRCNTNQTHAKFVRRHLDEDTVATRMADAGYVNGYFGKYMNGHAQDPGYVAPGWQRWVALTDATSLYNVDGAVRRINTDRVLADQFSADRCGEFIAQHTDRPWFAVFAPTAPHDPYTPSKKHVHDFDHVAWDPPAFNEKNLSDKPAFLRSISRQDRHKMQRIWEGKLEELRDVDDQIRDLVATMSRTGQLDNTVIMMISDNGYLLGEHRLFQKKQPYEESTGVPFVVRGPGFAPSAPRALVSQVDMMPTTLAAAGLDPDAGRALDGRSLLENLRSGDWSDWRRRLMSEEPREGWAMLREGDLAYIDYYSRSAEELYDLRQDPYQMRAIPADRVGRATAERSRARSEITAMRTAGGTQLRALEM